MIKELTCTETGEKTYPYACGNNYTEEMPFIIKLRNIESFSALKKFLLVHKNIINKQKQCNIHYPTNSRRKRRLNL
jgi:hypothetical protein